MVTNTKDRWAEFNYIIDDESLDSKEKLIILVLFRYVNFKTKFASPSRKLIKELTCIQHDKTLDKYLNSLIDKGYVYRVSGKGKRSKYHIEVPIKNDVLIKNEVSIVNEDIITAKNSSILPIKSDVQKENNEKIKEKIYINLSFVDDLINKVKITQEQYDHLLDKYGKMILHRKIIELDTNISNRKGSKYTDHHKVLNDWCGKEITVYNKEKNYKEEQQPNIWAGYKNLN